MATLALSHQPSATARESRVESQTQGSVHHRGVSAVLLDRDGVINRELGHFVGSWNEFEFLPSALEGLRRLSTASLPIVVVTNQSVVGRGWMTAGAADDINCRMKQTVAENGGRIDSVLVCPHAPEAGCECRKPRPGLLLRAAHEHGFDVTQAVMVGDSLRDLEAARAAGAFGVLVESGHDLPTNLDKSVPIARDLDQVVDTVLSFRRHSQE